MARPVIGIVNHSTCVKDQEIADALPDFQKWLDEDVAPAWKSAGADINFVVDKTAKFPDEWWLLTVMDHSDQIGALGYHEWTSAGMPLGFCFAGDDLRYGISWTGTFTHELGELVIDPNCHNAAICKHLGRTVLVLKEICDPCEDDSLGYVKGKTLCSDFVHPAFFETDLPHPEGTKFDQCGHITRPLQIASGGYMSILDPSTGQGWQPVYGQHVPLHKKWAPRGSRRERFMLRAQHDRAWEKSVARSN
jgi:hypothetical protein